MNADLPGDDIAEAACALGQTSIVNELLERGYNRNLKGLKSCLEVRETDEMNEKTKALDTINKMMTGS